MSKVNGDKARFNRMRKKNAAKRKRYRETLMQGTKGAKLEAARESK